MAGDEATSEVAMYISHQALQSMHEERVSTLLARSEQRRLLRQARDAAAGGTRRGRSWKSLLGAALGALLYGRGKPSYEPSSGVEQ